MWESKAQIESSRPEVCGEKDAKVSRQRRFFIRPVLHFPKCATEADLEFVDGLILKVADKKLFSSLLCSLPPLPSEFEHLKRINGSILLVKIGAIINEEELDRIEKIIKTKPELDSQLIPKNKPRSKDQLELCRRYWPMSIQKDAKLESLLDGTFLSLSESMRIKKLFMRVEMIGGALFYDPLQDRIVIETEAQFGENPLDHPVMRAVEALAEKQLSANFDQTTQYLATGYYAVLGMEPCTMCAMALVHSRVKSVFFGAFNDKRGALYSKWRLQESPHINHHFDVFQIIEEI